MQLFFGKKFDFTYIARFQDKVVSVLHVFSWNYCLTSDPVCKSLLSEDLEEITLFWNRAK